MLAYDSSVSSLFSVVGGAPVRASAMAAGPPKGGPGMDAVVNSQRRSRSISASAARRRAAFSTFPEPVRGTSVSPTTNRWRGTL